MAVLLPLVLCISAANLRPQEGPLPPHQPVAAFLALPVSPPAIDGPVIRVLDERGEPVPDASVFVADWSTLTDVERDAARHFFGADAPIWLAARTGRRFRTSAEGFVRVPKQAEATVGAIHPHTGAVALCLVGQRIKFRGGRQSIPVEVVDADGRPAAAVPVQIGRGHGDQFGAHSGAFTDERGRATLHCPVGTGASADVQVQVTCIDGPAAVTSVVLPNSAVEARLVQLRLPPVVGLRVRLQDRSGQAITTSRLTAIGTRFGGASPPLRVDGDGYLLWPIAPGGEVRLELRHAGAMGAPQVHTLLGPTKVGEVALHTLTIEVLPPAVPDPRLAAALELLNGAPPAGALPEAGPRDFRVRARGRHAAANTVRGVRVTLDPALAEIDGLRCELRGISDVGDVGDPSTHVLERDGKAPGAWPNIPALLQRHTHLQDVASRELPAVAPGRYEVRVLLGAIEVHRCPRIEVQEGDVGRAVSAASVPAAPLPTQVLRLLGRDGAPASGELVVEGHCAQRLATGVEGTVVVPVVAGVVWLATAPGGRTRRIPAARTAERLDVAVEARCRVRIVLPKDIVLPDGVLLRFDNPFDAELDTWHPWRTGGDNVVMPDAGGTTSVSLWLQRRDQSRVQVEGNWTIELPAGDREVAWELTLGAEQVEEIVKLQALRW